ncbi:CD82 antigen [Frankliniella fusca]|uniref:CD82 antigen n=1 Tax=Frankliniella fusca TaxID=407009 RepID=A0AAE1H998_9NEOP|nr:CD82 antigen [Frankliniella fusca]
MADWDRLEQEQDPSALEELSALAVVNYVRLAHERGTFGGDYIDRIALPWATMLALYSRLSTARAADASGLGAVVLGALLLSDAPRVLLSRLVLAASAYGGGAGPAQGLAPPQPLLYYVSLAAMGLGLVVCAVAVLGCWASCLRSYCILGTYLFLLTLLLLGEMAVGALGVLGPQFLGLAVEHPRLADALQRGYGVPGKEQLTAAFDLAQVSLACCGVTAGSDYHTSWWRLRELGQRDLLVPLSCCQLDNARDPDGFLDPRPSNLSLCQALQQDTVRPQRHMEGCGLKLGRWLSEQLQVLAAAGAALVLVQLLALLAAILVCVQLPRCRQKRREEQLQLQEQQDMQLRLSPRSENGFLDFDHTADKYANGGDTPPGDNNNTLLGRLPLPLGLPLGPPAYKHQSHRGYQGPGPPGPPRPSGPPGLIDMVDASVYHLPLPTEITPMVSPGGNMGPLHMGMGSPVLSQGKYITEEVVYHQTDSGAVKYSLPPRRGHQDSGIPPKPPPKPLGVPLPYDLCNCDLQKFYETGFPGAGPQQRLSAALEPSPYQYVEELRASPYQQALLQQAYHTKRSSTRPRRDTRPPSVHGGAVAGVRHSEQAQQQQAPQAQQAQQAQQQATTGGGGGAATPLPLPSPAANGGTQRSRRKQAERERQLLQEAA